MLTAVVTDVHYRMALALIRDLAEAGVRVVVCERASFLRDPAAPPLGFYSRRAAQTVVLSDESPLEDLYHLCQTLTERGGAAPALLPVGAATAALLARPEERARFAPVAGLLLPEPAVLARLNDKAAAGVLATQTGIPVPRTRIYPKQPVPSSTELPFPWVVKPVFGEGLGLTAAQRYAIVSTLEDAQSALVRFTRDGGRAVIQEYLPGSGFGCSVVARQGQVLASLCHRRIREYPVSGGPSSCCQAVAAPQLEAYVTRLVAATGYSGPAMFEFREDAHGNPRLLEVNPRIWGSFPLVRACGSPLARRWFSAAWQAGNPQLPEPQLPEPQLRLRRMRFLFSDLAAGLDYWRQGARRRGLGAFLDGLRPGIRDGVLDWKDPRPGLVYFRSLLRGR